MPPPKQKHKITTASISAPMPIDRIMPHSSASSRSKYSVDSEFDIKSAFPQYSGGFIDLHPSSYLDTTEPKQPSVTQKLWRYVGRKGDAHGASEKDRDDYFTQLDFKPQRGGALKKLQQSKSSTDLKTKSTKRSKGVPPALPLSFVDLGRPGSAGLITRYGTRTLAKAPKNVDGLEPLTPLGSFHESRKPPPEKIYFTPESMGWDADMDGHRNKNDCPGMSPYPGEAYLHHPSRHGSFVSLSAIWDEDFHGGNEWSGAKRYGTDSDQIDLVIPRRQF